MYPDVDRSKGQKRVEASGHTLPTHHQAAVFLLEPGKRPFRLEAWHHFFDRSAAIALGLPDALGELRPDTALAYRLPQGFGIIALICCNDLETFAGTTPFARVHLDGVELRHYLCLLIPIGRGDAVRPGHAVPRGEAVDEAPLARGKKRHQQRHTPNASSPVPRQSHESGLASQRAYHLPTTAVTSDAWRSSTPTVARRARHTSGSR